MVSTGRLGFFVSPESRSELSEELPPEVLPPLEELPPEELPPEEPPPEVLPVTWTLQTAVKPPSAVVTVISAVPGPLAVTLPEASTSATAGLPERQVTA